MSHDIVIYHNPRCGTSRNRLAMIRSASIEPRIIEYLETPPSRATLESLLVRMRITARDLFRAKEPLAKELGLDQPDVTQEQVLDAMAAHSVLMNRPIVVSLLGAKLCRPAELVLDLLPKS